MSDEHIDLHGVRHVPLQLHTRTREEPNSWDLAAKPINGDSQKVHVFGVLRKLDANQWTLQVHEAGKTVQFEAASMDDALAWVGTRVHGVDVPANRLENIVAEETTLEALRALNVMACRSDSLPGYVVALAKAYAEVIAEDTKPEGVEALTEHFAGVVTEHIKRVKAQRAFKDGLSKVLDNLQRMAEEAKEESQGDDKPAEPVKH